MPDKSPIANVIRNTLMVRRMGNGLAAQSDVLLHDLFDDLAAQMQRNASIITAWEPLAKNTVRNRAMQSVLNELDQTIGVGLDEIRAMSTQNLIATFEHQAGFAGDLLEQQIAGFGLNLDVGQISPTLARAVVERNPFQGHTLKEWSMAQKASTISKVRGQIQQGVIQNETIDDMVRRVRGRAVRPGVYKGGVMGTTTREARAIVRTAVNDVATQAHQALYSANQDITQEYEYLATLDLKTTERCAELDGQRFYYGEGPLPPQHWSCRSTTIPVVNWEALGIKAPPPAMRASMDGPVSAKTNYEGWLKKQSLARQQTVLGRAKGSLFSTGQISLSQLIRTDGSVLTLAEVRNLIGQQAAKTVVKKVKKVKAGALQIPGSHNWSEKQSQTLRRWEHDRRMQNYDGSVLFTHPKTGRVLFEASEGQGSVLGRYKEQGDILRSKRPVVSMINDKKWHKVADWQHFEMGRAFDASEVRIIHRGQVTRMMRPKAGWPDFYDDMQYFNDFRAITMRYATEINQKIISGDIVAGSATTHSLEVSLADRAMREFAAKHDILIISEKWKPAWTKQVEAAQAVEQQAIFTAQQVARQKKVAATGAEWEQGMERAVPDFTPAASVKEANAAAESVFADRAMYGSQKWTLRQANIVNQAIGSDLAPFFIRMNKVGVERQSSGAFYRSHTNSVARKLQDGRKKSWDAGQPFNKEAMVTRLNRTPQDMIMFERDNLAAGTKTWTGPTQKPSPKGPRSVLAKEYMDDAAALRGERGAEARLATREKYGLVGATASSIESMAFRLTNKAKIAKFDNGISNVAYINSPEQRLKAIAHHEAGHVIHYRGVDSKGVPMVQRWQWELESRGINTRSAPETYGVSVYAQTNFRELWSETWAMVRMGYRNLVPKPIMDAMDACMADYHLAKDFGQGATDFLSFGY